MNTDYNNTISWLQVSDLHLFTNSASTILHNNIKNYLCGGIDFLVVTGDLHQYEKEPACGIGNYSGTIVELEKLMDDLGLRDKKDVFFVPGNHDALDFDGKDRMILEIDKELKNNPDCYIKYVNELSRAFRVYTRFVDTFYENDNPYSGKELSNHIQVWKDRLALLHLNTAIACNGDNSRKPILNLMELSNLKADNDKYPTIALAHHSYYWLDDIQRPYVKRYLTDLGVRLYLCGDMHRESEESLKLGQSDIPVIVCAKYGIEPGDMWSRVGLIKYTWHYKTTDQPVEIEQFTWNEQKPGLVPDFTFVGEEEIKRSINGNQKAKRVFYIGKNTGYNTEWPFNRFKTLMEDTVKEVDNSLLFPWMKLSSQTFSLISNGIYIQPRIKLLDTGKYMTFEAFLELYAQMEARRLWVIGEAGIGKSSLLKEQFLTRFRAGEKVIYLSATELIRSDPNEKGIFVNWLLLSEELPPKDLLILIDGLDEAFNGNGKDFLLFLENCKKLDCAIWFGCRSQFFEKYVDNVDAPRIELSQWDWCKAKQYAETYFTSISRFDLYANFCLLHAHNREFSSFTSNPFRLSLIVYLLENKDIRQMNLQNNFSLYREFFDLWFNKERSRDHKYTDKKEAVYSDLCRIARALYINACLNETVITTDDPAVLGLLIAEMRGNNEWRINAFFHRSFMEYVLAYETIEAMKKGTSEIIENLKLNHRSDVDEFVKAGFATLNYEMKNRIVRNLIDSYHTAAIEQTSMSTDDLLYIHNQIIYYLTRMTGMNLEPVKEFISEIYRRETRPIMKQGIAYGAANLGLFDIALDFAKRMTPGSIEDITNRSWTLVFYGDTPYEDPMHYVDDGIVSWERSKKARLRRLQGQSAKDRAFRMFDLCILRGFLKSRSWKGLSEKDFEIIKHCETKIPNYSSDITDFLMKTKETLVHEYEANAVK